MKPQAFSDSLKFTKHKFNDQLLAKLEDDVWAKSLWPLVYILSDEKLKEAYVGESTSAIARMQQHLSNKDRRKLNTVHLITSDRFNKSATLDLEADLIKYMSGEATFKLQNGNAGLSQHTYYQRNEYMEIFEQVWAKLMREKLASKTRKEIDNSSLFKYSPYKSLTEDQFEAVEAIFSTLIEKSKSSIFIGGSAGTGKTILAVFLIKLLKTDLATILDTGEIEGGERKTLIADLKQKYPDPKVALVVPMSSLRKTLKKVFRNVKGLSADMVIGPSEVSKKKYNILLVDESHRLRRRVNLSNYKTFDDNNKRLKLGKKGTELDWIKKQSDHQIFFYDPAQSIKPTDILKDDFDKVYQKADETIELKSQLRVLGGRDYIDYIDKLLKGNLTSKTKVFKAQEYEFVLFDSLKTLINKLKEKEKEVELCRLVAGYAWEWRSRRRAVPDIEIEDLKLKWNSDNGDWINTVNAINEVGCIHTTQGYDLNYTGVIFGREISYDPKTDQIIILAENYHDRNGKSGIKDPRVLKEYIINIYKTLMYRGIRGTYVYVTDEKLREYFRKHIPPFEEGYSPKVIPLNKVKPYINSIPLYNLSAAAGSFSPPQHVSDCEWLELPPGYKHKNSYFACRVVGESMNKRIPSGSWCLFERDPGGTREGKIVLVEHRKIHDDIGSGYTVKEYHGKKKEENGKLINSEIILKPLSNDPSFRNIILTPEDDLTELKVSGIFVDVLK